MKLAPSIFGEKWGQRIANAGLAIAKLAGYDAGVPAVTMTQRSWVGNNPNSIRAQIERNNMQWNADYVAKNVAFAIGYLKIRRNYCSPQGWLPNTGDKELNKEVKAYCEERWKDMGVNCSMWTSFSRASDIELPTRGDSALVWYRDESRLRLMEVSADQIGELFFYQNPSEPIPGLTYFAGMYFDRHGIRQGMKVYERGWNDFYTNPQNFPASDVIYFQDNLVRGIRGITAFHGAIESMTKAGKMLQYGLDAAQKQAKTAVVASNNSGAPQELSYETINENGQVTLIEQNHDGAVTQFQYVGDSYELVQTTAPGPELIAGCRYADEQAALSLAMPYAFLVNAATEGGAPYRGELGKAGKEINRIRKLHEAEFRKISYVTIMDGFDRGAFGRGIASEFLEKLTEGTVVFPSDPTADSFREAKEDLMYVRAGLDSPQRVLGRSRENPEEILDENQEWAIMVSKSVQDANKELESEGYEGNITNVDIAQPMDNMQQAASAEQIDSGKSPAATDNSSPARMSAFMCDIPISSLPEDLLSFIKSIHPEVDNDAKVSKYGMVAPELERMADPHNLESAKRNIRYCSNGSCADEVHANSEKHILVNNGRVVDGHHFLSKALKGKVTKSLPVIDLSPLRFQTAQLRDWQESKHPRASDGEFGTVAHRGEGNNPEKKKTKSPEEKKAEADHKFEGLMEGKSESDQKAFRAARADGIAIPPAWTDVEYFGKDANTVARGRDEKGRRQVAENPEYRQKVSDANNARISKDLTPRMGEIRDRLREDAKAGNEEAKVLYLITQSGFRIGGKGDGKAKVEAFGASSLLGDHVKSDEHGAHFDFLGKKGVRQQHSINDPVIQDFVKNAEPGKPLFSTTAEKVRAAWQDKYGGAKVHDIRHVVATELASSELDNRLAAGRPKTEKEKIALVKEVAKVVGSKLGNNPAQALGTYIDPKLWTKI